MGNIVAQSQRAALALGGITAAGGALVSGFIAKAGEMQQFEAQLRAITGSSEQAKAQLQAMADFAAKTPFDLPGVVQAGIKLKALGQDADHFLPLAGNLAAAMGRQIPDAALALGKALSGSQDGIQVLADSYGITRMEMAKFGAETDKAGTIQVKTAAQIDKLKTALETIIKQKFGHTMEEQSKTLNGAFSNLSDSVGQLQASFGQELAPAVEAVARSVTGVLESFKSLDPYSKALIANGALIGTVLTGVAAAGNALQAALLPATTYFAAFGATAQASAVANTQAAVAAHATAVALVTQTEAEVAAAAALVEEAAASTANAATKEAGILAAEGLAIAETELAAATEAAAIASGQYAGTSAAVGAAMGAQTVAAGGLTVAMQGLLFSVGGIALALGALIGGGLILATKSWEEYTTSTEKTIAVSKRQLKAFHEQRDATLEVAAAIKKYGSATKEAVDEVSAAFAKMGKDDLDLTHAIAGNEELRKQAAEDGNAAQEEILIKRIDLLRKLRTTLRGSHDKEVAEAAEKTAAAKKVQEANEALLKSYEEKDKANVFSDSREQLAALDKLLASLDKTNAKYKELTLSRVALARKAAMEEETENEKARKNQIEGEQHKLDLIVGNDAKAHQQRIALLSELVKDHRLKTEERHRLEVQLARETMELDKTQAESKKKAEAEKLKAAEEAAKAQEKLTQAQQKANDADLKVLEEKFRQGEPVMEQLEAEIKKRDELANKLEREKALAEGIGKSNNTRAALQKGAAAEAEAREKTSRIEIDKLREQQAKRQADRAAKDGDQAVQVLKAQEDQAKKNYDLDASAYEELKRKMEARQKAEQQALVLKAQGASVGASAEEKSRIQKELAIDLLALTTKQTEESRGLTNEKQKQLDLLKETKKESVDFTLGKVTSGVDAAGDFSAFDVKKLGKTADASKAKRDAAADKTKAEAAAKDATKGTDFAGSGGTFEAMLAQLTKTNQLLDTIQKSPVKVEVRGAGGAAGAATEAADWRTSTNKTGE